MSVIHSSPINCSQHIYFLFKKPGAAAMLQEQQKYTKYLKASKQLAHNLVTFILNHMEEWESIQKNFRKKMQKTQCIKFTIVKRRFTCTIDSTIT